MKKKSVIIGIIAMVLLQSMVVSISTADPGPDYDLLIITPENFEDELEPLRDFKIATGRPSVIVTLEDIYDDYVGDDEAEEIKMCIADYENDHNVKYVMLVGDVDLLPMRYFYLKSEVTDEVRWLQYYLTDHYYADLYDGGGGFCSWDDDGDGIYGEMIDDDDDGDYDNIDGIDFEFDVVVGRIPVDTAVEVERYVNKVIKYETEVEYNSWFKNILLATGTGDWVYPSLPTTWDIDQNDQISTEMATAGFSSVKLYHSNTPGNPDYPNPTNINNNLNAGAGFMNVISHGCEVSWGVYDVRWDMAGLTNQDKLTVVYSFGCGTAKVGPIAAMDPYIDVGGTLRDYGTDYDPDYYPHPKSTWVEPAEPDPLQDSTTDIDCMPEYWNFYSDKGAVAFIGSTAEASGAMGSPVMQYFFESFASDGHRVLGDVWNSVSDKVHAGGHGIGTDWDHSRRWLYINVFGDPTLYLGGLPEKPPEADANGLYTIVEGASLILDGSGSSDPEGDPLTFSWDLDNDGNYDDATGETPTISWSTFISLGLDDDGTYTIGLEVSDGEFSDTDSTTITINNLAPTITVTGDTINENEYATVSGTIYDPSPQDTFTLVIDWGEGTDTYTYGAGTTTYSETHQYLDDNPTATPSDDYGIIVTINDDDGGLDTATATVTVNNVAPSFGASGSTIDENSIATISGSISDPGTLDTFTIEIDWDEGSPQYYTYPAGTTTFSETHQYLDDDPTGTAMDVYSASVTVTDDDTGSSTEGVAVLVYNVAPTLTLSGDVISENGVATVSGTITDPGTLDTFILVINWGEGAPETYSYPAGTTSYSLTHQYLDDNPTATPSDDYSITVTITDDDTGVGTASTTVTVNNVAPTITATGETINENDIATVIGTITDPGTQDTFTLTIDWGEGIDTYTYAAGTTSYSETHQYLDDNPTATPTDEYSITVTITDDDTGIGTVSTTVTVNNVAPEITVFGMDQPNPQFILPIVHELTFTGDFFDPGTLDTHTSLWEFGDGDTASTLTTTHIYSHPGIYQVNLTIEDDDTGVVVETMDIEVVDEFGALHDIDDYIQNLENESFKGNPTQRKKAFHNMILAIEDQLVDMEYKGSIKDLRKNIRSKADGFIDGGPKNDWIIDPIAQQHICMKIDDLTAYLEYLLTL